MRNAKGGGTICRNRGTCNRVRPTNSWRVPTRMFPKLVEEFLRGSPIPTILKVTPFEEQEIRTKKTNRLCVNAHIVEFLMWLGDSLWSLESTFDDTSYGFLGVRR